MGYGGASGSNELTLAQWGYNNNNYLIKNIISVRYKQDFINVTPSEVDFISISTIQVVSVAASLIPFFEHDDANRALMGSNMQRQSVPLIFPQKPIVGTGLENQIAIDSGMTLNAHISGIVHSVTANKIIIKDNNNKKVIYHFKATCMRIPISRSPGKGGVGRGNTKRHITITKI